MNKVYEVKKQNLEKLAEYRDTLLKKPVLRHLFLELTLRCNQFCIHCGSRCGEHENPPELTLGQYKKILDDIKRDFDISKFQLNITGGEPMLRRDFFDIMEYANKLGYLWGMTSNASLITDETARRLYECGMKTISVSIDGLRDTHDSLRGKKGAYDSAMRGIEALCKVGKFQNVQVTTVINHSNICELDALFDIMTSIDIDSWRVINIEPMGRACDHPELVLTKEEYKYLFDYIRNKRLEGYPVEYGCSHYLGLEYERTVRDWYFICTAGIYTASIMANGNIVSCLDIERRPELVQGNILTDNFKDVWENRFEVFRQNLSDKNEKCRKCEHARYCNGGAHHSWDYDRDEPIVCFKDILF